MIHGLVILLLLVGLAFLAAEVFVIPGFGVTGILGIVCVGGAAILGWVKLGPLYGGATLGGGVLVALGFVLLVPHTKMGKAMVLSASQVGTRAADVRLAELVGLLGRTLTPLRPAGTAEIAGRPVDVVADGQYVEEGTQVRVARVEGMRVVVETVLSKEESRG